SIMGPPKFQASGGGPTACRGGPSTACALLNQVGMKNGVLLSSVLVLSFQAACGSDQPVSTSEASVLNSDVTQTTLRQLGGGFGPQTPAGAACQLGVETYDVSLTTSMLTYSRCHEAGDFNVAASYTPQSGTLSLTPAQLAMVRTALGNV